MIAPSFRVRRGSFKQNNGRWDTSTAAGLRYTYVSHVHKMTAAVYYFVNIRAAVRLGDSVYYAKEEWVTLFNQTGGSQLELRRLLQRRHNTLDDIVAVNAHTRHRAAPASTGASPVAGVA